MGLGSDCKKRPHAIYSDPAARAGSNAPNRSAERERQTIKARLRLLNLLLGTINGQAARLAAHRQEIIASQRRLDAEANHTRRQKKRNAK